MSIIIYKLLFRKVVLKWAKILKDLAQMKNRGV